MAPISQVWKTVSEDFDFADVDEIALTVARPWYNSPKLNNSKSKLRNDTEKFLEASETDSMQSGIKEEIIDNNDQRDLPFKCALSETETDWDEVNRDNHFPEAELKTFSVEQSKSQIKCESNETLV